MYHSSSYIAGHGLDTHVVAALLTLSATQPDRPFAWLAEHFSRLSAEHERDGPRSASLGTYPPDPELPSEERALTNGAAVESSSDSRGRRRKGGVSEPSDQGYADQATGLTLTAEEMSALFGPKSHEPPEMLSSEHRVQIVRRQSGTLVKSSSATGPGSGRTGGRRSRKKRSADAPDGSRGGTEQHVGPATVASRAALQSVFADAVLFRDLTAAERDAVCSVMVPEVFAAGEVIIAQGDQGDKFYVLESGTCVIRKVLGKKKGPTDFGTEVMRLEDAGSFGELALMYGSPRAASVIAETKVKVWSIDRSTYRTCLMQHTMSKRARYCDFLRKVPLLAELEPYQIVIVADAMTTFNFPAGRAIVHEGEEGDYFYIIEEGRCSVSKSDPSSGLQYSVGELAIGSYFGEVALLTDAPRQATVTALTDVRCVGLDRARFSRVLGPCEELLRTKMADYNLPQDEEGSDE